MKLFIPLAIFFLLLSCENSPVELKNDQINKDIQKEIKVLNALLLSGIEKKNVDGLVGLLDLESFGGEEKAKKDLEEKVFAHLDEHFIPKKFKIIDQYYLNGWETMGKTYSGSFRGHEYSFSLPARSSISHVTFGYFDTDAREKQFLMIGYVLMPKGWKLYLLKPGIILTYEKDSIEWYEESVAQLKKGNKMGAMIRLMVALLRIRPEGKWFKYDREKEVGLFKEKLWKELEKSYSFPLAVTDLEFMPVLNGVEVRFLEDGIAPVITYSSSVHGELEDFEKEARELHGIIDSVFEGLSEESTIVYRVKDLSSMKGEYLEFVFNN